MADLYISEHKNGVSGIGTYVAQMLPEPAVTIQKVAIGGASVQSAAFNEKTYAVQIVADGACHVLFGSDPTATSSSMYLPANVPYYRGVAPGDKIAVIS